MTNHDKNTQTSNKQTYFIYAPWMLWGNCCVFSMHKEFSRTTHRQSQRCIPANQKTNLDKDKQRHIQTNRKQTTDKQKTINFNTVLCFMDALGNQSQVPSACIHCLPVCPVTDWYPTSMKNKYLVRVAINHVIQTYIFEQTNFSLYCFLDNLEAIPESSTCIQIFSRPVTGCLQTTKTKDQSRHTQRDKQTSNKLTLVMLHGCFGQSQYLQPTSRTLPDPFTGCPQTAIFNKR